MGLSVFPTPSAGKTRKVETLTSGTSWTVPAGVTYVNVLLVGGGGGGGAANGASFSGDGLPGSSIESNVTTTPGASITYAIGAGGSGGTTGATNSRGGTGGTTTFTGATSAGGGVGGMPTNGNAFTGGAGLTSAVSNFGQGAYNPNANASGGAGGSGWISIEYWV
jgi:hypothetical protein